MASVCLRLWSKSAARPRFWMQIEPFDQAPRSLGHLEPMTPSARRTKGTEWQTFHYWPAIVPQGEINYKNTTNSKDNSSVLHCAGMSWLLFFLKGLLTSPASPWCNLLSIWNPIAFWNWIYLAHSHSEWTLLPQEKKRRNCLRSREVLDLSGTSVSAASFQIGRPHYREEGGAGRWDKAGRRAPPPKPRTRNTSRFGSLMEQLPKLQLEMKTSEKHLCWEKVLLPNFEFEGRFLLWMNIKSENKRCAPQAFGKLRDFHFRMNSLHRRK